MFIHHQGSLGSTLPFRGTVEDAEPPNDVTDDSDSTGGNTGKMKTLKVTISNRRVPKMKTLKVTIFNRRVSVPNLTISIGHRPDLEITVIGGRREIKQKRCLQCRDEDNGQSAGKRTSSTRAQGSAREARAEKIQAAIKALTTAIGCKRSADT